MTKRLLICADDFGQNREISEGIVALAKNNRINSISCMTNMAAWSEASKDLANLKSTKFIGLHFNLTFGEAKSHAWKRHYDEKFPSLFKLLTKVYANKLSIKIVEEEIEAQLTEFIDKLGELPDFFDGHQHIHQLPIIRNALLKLSQRYQKPMRNTFNRPHHPKQLALCLLGGLTFRRQLRANQIPTNKSFSGAYHFSHAKNYGDYFKKFLAQSRDGGLVMCHPGLLSHDFTDPLSAFRYHEWVYFNSDEYCQDLASQQIKLVTKEELNLRQLFK